METMNNHAAIRKITRIALFVSLSLILSYFDIIVSRAAFPFLPTTKIGFANIIVVYAIYQMDFKESLIIAVMKSMLSLLLGNVIGFIISICASVLSFFGMYGAYRAAENRLADFHQRHRRIPAHRRPAAGGADHLPAGGGPAVLQRDRHLRIPGHEHSDRIHHPAPSCLCENKKLLKISSLRVFFAFPERVLVFDFLIEGNVGQINHQ